jgi:ribosomal protein S8
MKRTICNFLAILNQTVKKNKNHFNFTYFRQAPALLQALVDAGYVQYYTRSGTQLTIYLRVNSEGPVLSQVKQNSKPSKKIFVRWKQLKKENALTLVLVDQKLMTSDEAILAKKGGISIATIL